MLKQIFCNQISELQKKSGSVDIFVLEYGDEADIWTCFKDWEQKFQQ